MPKSTALYFSLLSSDTLGGLTVAKEDVVHFDGSTFSLYLDGSDVGLGGYRYRIDALSVINSSQLLLSFTREVSLPGISGTVGDADASSIGC